MQKALARVRFGADPELFLCSRGPSKEEPKAVSQPVIITGMVGGTKQKPLPLTTKLKGWEGIGKIPKGTMIQEDGPAIEFNVAPADHTGRLINDCSSIVAAIRGFALRKGMGVWPSAIAEFPEEARKASPTTFIVGCDPDRNAYTQQERKVPQSVQDSLTRFAGGHFHVGYDKDLIPPHIVVQFLDLVLGLPSLTSDKQGLRRQFYGQAGTYRVKEYGVEYRTLSNFWLPGFTYDTDLISLLFRGADVLMTQLHTKMEAMEYLHQLINWEQVQTAINTENLEMARQIIEQAMKINPDLMDEPRRFFNYTNKPHKVKSGER